jgi:hypothetical protein
VNERIAELVETKEEIERLLSDFNGKLEGIQREVK